MNEKKYIYFVTGLPHSGTSIIQKTIGDQAGYYVEYKASKNIEENTSFDIELDMIKNIEKHGYVYNWRKDIHYNSVEDYWKNESKVTKLPCTADDLVQVFERINAFIDDPNLCFIFTKRDSIEWCSSYLMRKVHPLDLKKHIDDEWSGQKIMDFNYHYKNRKDKFIDNKKSFVIYLKELHDAYYKNINIIINSKPKAKVVCVDLLDFAENPKEFLRAAGFEDMVISGADDGNRHVIQKMRQYEEKRALQITQKPDPNMIVKEFDFHPTLQDFLQETFK
jgi:hypothetical protein